MGEGEGGAGVQHPVATAGQVLRVEAGEGEGIWAELVTNTSSNAESEAASKYGGD